MNQKITNLSLLAIVVLLAINLFSPLEFTGKVVDLKCEINGNLIGNVNLCCHEMQRFPLCENNVCEDDNYVVRYNADVLDYCEDKGYDITR